MTNVFISYSRKNKKAAERLTEAFKAQDLDFWIDWEGIEPTVDWWREIEKGIEGADNFLFLISPDSVKSAVCKREIEHAVRNGKRLIPVVVQDIKSDEAPEELRPLNWIFLRPEDDALKNFNILSVAIRTDFDWVQTQRRLQVKALEWERGSRENSLLLRGKDLQTAESQLVINSSKEPHPTDLQREFVLLSRQASERQRRRVILVSIAAAILMAGLAFFGSNQAKLAAEREKTASARQLAAQSQTLSLESGTTVIQSGLLAVEAGRRNAAWTADQALRRYLGNTSPRLGSIQHEDRVTSLQFSPDGKYVVSVSADSTARVWEAETGREISRIEHSNTISTAVFSPDGRYVLWAGCDHYDEGCLQGSARVWEADTGREIARSEHGESVMQAMFIQDGKFVLSQSANLVRIWDPLTGREIRHLDDDAVAGVHIDSAGRWIASGDCIKGDFNGNCVTSVIWVRDLVTGEEISRFTDEGWAGSIFFSQDGRRIVSGGCDRTDTEQKFAIVQPCLHGTVRVWEAATGQEITRVDSDGYIDIIGISPSARYVMTEHDNTYQLLDVSRRRESAVPAVGGKVVTVAFSPDGKLILIGNDAGIVQLWQVATGLEKARIALDSRVTSLTLSPDGRFVAAGSSDGFAGVWALSAPGDIHLTHPEEVPSLLAISQNGKYAAYGNGSGTAQVLETATGREFIRTEYASGVPLFEFSRDARDGASAGCERVSLQKKAAGLLSLLTPSWRSTPLPHTEVEIPSTEVCTQYSAKIWEMSTRKQVSTILLSDTVTSLVFSPDGSYMATAGCDNTFAGSSQICIFNVRIWETATGRAIASQNFPGEFATTLAFSPDGKRVISSVCHKDIVGYCATPFISIWDAVTGKQIATPRYNLWAFVNVAAFSPDGNYIAIGAQNNADVLETSTGKEIAGMEHEASVSAVAFSADGKYVVSGSNDGTTLVWEGLTEKELARITYDAGVNTVAFSSDGNYVVSGSDDGIARVWETATGNELARVEHAASVNFVAFNADGSRLVVGSEDGSVGIWTWQIEELMEKACTHLSRNLTFAEWTQFVGKEPYQLTCPNLPAP